METRISFSIWGNRIRVQINGKTVEYIKRSKT